MAVQSRIVGAAFIVAVLSFMATTEGNELVFEQVEHLKPYFERAFKVYVDAAQAAIRVFAMRYGPKYADLVFWLVHLMTVTFLWRLLCSLPWLITIPFRIIVSFL
ncbi:hypothetical protein KCU78_g4940, partial [Aureobasidium melanogenum]